MKKALIVFLVILAISNCILCLTMALYNFHKEFQLEVFSPEYNRLSELWKDWYGGIWFSFIPMILAGIISKLYERE